MGDYAYGGDPTGYSLSVGVGEAVTQNLPIDITQTTVNFSVSLKHGDETGDAVPGAVVNLYTDATGMNMVGTDTTDAMGMASIVVARAAATGNTVHAAVSHDDYDGPAGRQAVMWDPQKTYTMASNDGDMVNLAVDAMFNGATITTEYGGGKALAGWAISVMHGETALEGDNVSEALDEDGMGAWTSGVAADELPATFTIAVADDQANAMDGGEKYEATSLEYVHTGLSLAGTMDAGTIEVQYTTQTLKVYVHHEVRTRSTATPGTSSVATQGPPGYINVDIRYIADNGRSRRVRDRRLEEDQNDLLGLQGRCGTPSRGVPADRQRHRSVADEVADTTKNVMLLDPDELAAYTDMEANGIMGGAFGDMGGFHHTVELCPLMRTSIPRAQDHGECGSFAFVSTLPRARTGVDMNDVTS